MDPISMAQIAQKLEELERLVNKLKQRVKNLEDEVEALRSKVK